MSLIHFAHEFDGHPSRGFDDLFYPARRIVRTPLGALLASPTHEGIFDQWLNSRSVKDRDAVATVGKDGLQVCLDVHQYKPSEITVKTVDNSIVVEGKHEERPDDHGYISRQFVRRYSIPHGYDVDQVISTLSSDGVLTIKAPPPKTSGANEKHIQIQQTGPAHLSVKSSDKEDVAKKE